MRLRIDEVTNDGKKSLSVLEGSQPAVSVVVGRDLTCDIPITSEAVSRNHGRFFGFESGWAYKDLGSTNGSWINGVKISTNSIVALFDGDYIQIADIVLRVSYETKLFEDISNRKFGWRLFAIKEESEGLELDPSQFEGHISGQDGICFDLTSDSESGRSSVIVSSEDGSVPIVVNGEVINNSKILNAKDEVSCGDFTYLVVYGDLCNIKSLKTAPILSDKVAMNVDLTAVDKQNNNATEREPVVFSAERTSYIDSNRVAAVKFGSKLGSDNDNNEDYDNTFDNSSSSIGVVESIQQFFFRLTDLERKIVIGSVFFLIASFLVLILLLIV
jgi:hypothetical protein